jgi:hypothetical protein
MIAPGALGKAGSSYRRAVLMHAKARRLKPPLRNYETARTCGDTLSRRTRGREGDSVARAGIVRRVRLRSAGESASEVNQMKRSLLRRLTAPSLLLFIAITALWLRSYWRDEGFRFRRVPQPEWHAELRAMSSGGSIMLVREETQAVSGEKRARPGFEWISRMRSTDAPGLRGLLGIYLKRWTQTAPRGSGVESQTWLELPYWLLAFATLVLPGRRLYLHVRQRRSRP